jgi:tRNA dimethylallyltransferase
MPGDRAVLHARIAARFDAMLEAGLVEEVRALRRRHVLHPNLPSMRCVGYRQVWAHLDGAYDRATLRNRGVAATRQLAKRQLTWLRSLPEVELFGDADRLAARLRERLEASQPAA